MFKSNVTKQQEEQRDRKYSLPHSQKDTNSVQMEGFDDFERQIRQRIEKNITKNNKPDSSSDIMKYQMKNLSFFKSLNTSKPVGKADTGTNILTNKGGVLAKVRPPSVGSLGKNLHLDASADLNFAASPKAAEVVLRWSSNKVARAGSFEVPQNSKSGPEKSLLLVPNDLEYSVHEMRHHRAKSDVNRDMLSGKLRSPSPIYDMAIKAGVKLGPTTSSSAQETLSRQAQLNEEHPFDQLVTSINQKKKKLQEVASGPPTTPDSFGRGATTSYFLSKKPGLNSRLPIGIPKSPLAERNISIPDKLSSSISTQGQDKWAISKLQQPDKHGSSAWNFPPRLGSGGLSHFRTEPLVSKNSQEQKFDWKSYPSSSGGILVENRLKSGESADRNGVGSLGSFPVKGFGFSHKKTAPNSGQLFGTYSQAARLVSQIGRPSSASESLGLKKSDAMIDMEGIFKKKSILDHTAHMVEQRNNFSLFENKSFGRLETQSAHQKLKKTAQTDAKFWGTKQKLLEMNSSLKGSETISQSGTLLLGRASAKADLTSGAFTQASNQDQGKHRPAYLGFKEDATSVNITRSGFFRGTKKPGQQVSKLGIPSHPSLTKSSFLLN